VTLAHPPARNVFTALLFLILIFGALCLHSPTRVEHINSVPATSTVKAGVNLVDNIHKVELSTPDTSVAAAPAPTRSDTDPATKLVVAFTGNRWTTDKLLIATGTLTNTNPMPVTITRIIATGFDKQQNVVAGGPGAPEKADYTIGNAEIDAGATTIFKVALSDPKKDRRVTLCLEIDNTRSSRQSMR
jgi:hypothetical protein